MYRMKNNNSMDIQHRNRQNSDAEMTNYSGPLTKKGGSTGSKKSARFNIPGETTASTSTNSGDDAYVEITLEVSDDAVAVHSVKAAGGGEIEEPELALLARGLEKKSSMVRNASSRIKHFSQELKRLASFTRRPPVGKYDRTKSAAAHALMGLKFISKTDGAAGWAAVADRYAKLTTDKNGLPIGNGLLPRSLFWKCIGMNESSKAFAEELFDAMARRRSINVESLSLHQLKDFWEQMSDQSFDTRLQTFFDMVDKDADGRISEEEVKEIISLSASANSLSKIQNQADEYAALIMEELDPNNKGYILLENLEMLLLQAPHTAKQVRGESKVLSQMLSQKLKPTLDHNVVRRWYEEFRYFLVDNWQRAWVLVLWIGVMAGLFAYKYIQYKNRAAYDVMGACVSLAKGGAETTKLNMALILLPVCRNTITWLRNKTRLGAVVPFDDNLNFHKVIAVAIALGAGIHAISHLTCDFPRLIHASEEKYEPMIQYFGEQPENYWHFVKSVEGVTGIIMVVLMAIAFTLASPWFRRSRLNLPSPLKRLTGFNAFWYSHHLFVIVYALLIVHGEKLYLTKQWYKRTTWMYLVVPLALYAGERLTRALRSSVKPVSILKVAVYPGNVLALHMSKPQGFKYKSGQYMFVNCPAVSPFEWHPFSITSAPRDDYLSVHIRTLGDWTRQLRLVFSQVCREPETGKSGLLRFEPEHLEGTSDYSPNFPKVMIDGPYGAPAQDYKKYDVVLLVGLGIGATPMISIVKDIVNNMKAIEEEEQALENGTASTPPNGSPLSQKRKGASSAGGGNFRTKRAYFYWITREQGSFDWFKGIMNEVAETDKKGVIEMHNYCTSVYEEGDARSALITMLQSLNHAKNGVDVVSGTRVKSHFAKPNWRNVYKRIALNHKDQRVGVFYCGAPGLTNELRQLATDFTRKSDTKFDFHKENF